MSTRPKAVRQGRRRPKLVATRVTAAQKDLIVALARLERRTVTGLLFDLVVPVVKERLAQRLDATGVSE